MPSDSPTSQTPAPHRLDVTPRSGLAADRPGAQPVDAPSPDGEGTSRAVILTLSCPDAPGIVAAVSGFLAERGCNITQSAQFGDAQSGLFFMRVVFHPIVPAPDHAPAALGRDFEAVAGRFGMTWQLHDAAERPRVLIMVSKFGHCLNDLLFRWSVGQLRIDIPAIVSNHTDFEPLARSHGIPFIHLPVDAASKAAQEDQVYDIVQRERVELVVLARYMQVLSDNLCRRLHGRAINIHHSFLPSFKGARPYHQAFQRGVKLIGATAHYVTPALDEGPIIEQDVARVDHEMDPTTLAAAGRDVESQVLARAVRWHVERRVLLNSDRTVIFR